MRHLFALMLMLVGLLLITAACVGTTSAHLLASQPIPFAPDARIARPTPTPQSGATSTPAPGVKVPAGLVNALIFHGSGSRKEVVLTFDDGPDITYTPKILAILSQYHLHATFFHIGQRVLTYPQITRKVYAAGHTIGNHSWSHPPLTALGPAWVLWQMEHTNQIIQQTIGIRPTLMRPPYEAINSMVRIQVKRTGLLPIMGDVDSEDWKRLGVTTIVQTTLRETRNGSIILMHDGGGNRTQTVMALPLIIQALEQRGYTIVTMQHLLDHYADRTGPTGTPTITPRIK